MNRDEARALITRAMEDPHGSEEDENVILAGLWGYYDGLLPSAHQCYWNDRFCVAVMCGLPLEFKRTSAHALCRNGRAGYFEWCTHAKYDVKKVFEHLGINLLGVDAFQDGLYSVLSKRVIVQLEKMFSFQTSNFLSIQYSTH